jgi:hypothetical protein
MVPLQLIMQIRRISDTYSKNVALLSLEHDNYVSIKTDNFLQLPNLL